MRKKIEWSWEKLDENTYRAKVIGGWMVMHVTVDRKKMASFSESLAFIPDRDHEWTIVLPIVEETPKPRIDPRDFEAPAS